MLVIGNIFIYSVATFRIEARFRNSGTKNIPLGEKRQLQLRWAIYNIFNHANFDDIDGTLTFGLVQNNPGGSSLACTAAGNTCTASIQMTRNTFGTPTTARTPRVMQASIRLNF